MVRGKTGLILNVFLEDDENQEKPVRISKLRYVFKPATSRIYVAWGHYEDASIVSRSVGMRANVL
jgi:hypothetical protein